MASFRSYLSAMAFPVAIFTIIIWLIEYASGMNFYVLTKRMFGDRINKESDETETYYTVCDQPVSIFGVKALYSLQYIVQLYSMSAFWLEFIVNNTDHCEDGWDCFAYSGNYLTIPVQQDPLENCTDYENGSYTVECFQFSTNFISALGAAGGISVVMHAIIYLHLDIWVKVVSTGKKRDLSNVVLNTIIAVIAAIYFVVFVIVSLIFVSVPYFRERVFDTTKHLHFTVSYLIVSLMVFLTCGPFIAFSIVSYKTLST